jgi:hypothetical protein
MDVDNIKYLDSKSFTAGLKKLVHITFPSMSRLELIPCLSCSQQFKPPISLTEGDFDGLTEKLGLNDKTMGVGAFERLMREQLKLYTQSRLSSMSEFWTTTEQEFTTIGTLKHILMEQIKIQEQLSHLRGSGKNAASGVPKMPTADRVQDESKPSFALEDVDNLLDSFRLFFKDTLSARVAERGSTQSLAPILKIRGTGMETPRTPGSTTQKNRRSKNFNQGRWLLDDSGGHSEGGGDQEGDELQRAKINGLLSTSEKRRRKVSPSRAPGSVKGRGSSPRDGSSSVGPENDRRLYLDGPVAAAADLADPPTTSRVGEQTSLPEEPLDCRTADALPPDPELTSPKPAALLQLSQRRRVKPPATVHAQLAYAEATPATPYTPLTGVASPDETGARRKGPKRRSGSSVSVDGLGSAEAAGGGCKSPEAETDAASGNGALQDTGGPLSSPPGSWRGGPP